MVKAKNMKNRGLFWLVLLVLLIPLIVSTALSRGRSWSAFPCVKVKASTIEWKERPSWWDANIPVFSGYRKPNLFYSLTLIEVPSSKCIVETTKAWLRQHPDAEAVQVLDADGAGGYVWVVDGEDNLNIHLVRMGCYDYEFMVVQEGYRTCLSANYRDFLQKLIKAEKAAEADKVGIWSKSKD